MKSTARLQNVAAFLLEEAKRLGATDADVNISNSTSGSIDIWKGEVEQTTDCVDSHSVSLRVFIGQRTHSQSVTDLRRPALRRLAKEVVETTKGGSEDKFAGLPDKKYLATSIPQLDLHCSELSKLSDKEKARLAIESEQAAKKVSDKITDIEASFSTSGGNYVYANTRGFLGFYSYSGWQLMTKVVVEQTDEKKVGYWWESGRKLAQLGDPTAIGKTAAERAARQLGARKVASCQAPVIYDPMMAGRLIAQFASAADGSAIARRNSFLVDKIGQQVAASKVSIIDDPLLDIGQASRPWGSEGIPVQKRTFVRDGKLECYFIDAYSGRMLGCDPNGGGRSNLYIPNGDVSPEDMIKSVKSGLYLTSVSGPGFNATNGNYSMGASGFWIENGELAFPVEEITVGGNIVEMFNAIEVIGNDLSFRTASASPTLLIGKMTIAGK